MTKPGSSPIRTSSTPTLDDIVTVQMAGRRGSLKTGIASINPEEVVFHVGDLALGKKEDLEVLASLLNGRLYLMRGNHDRRSCAFYHHLGISLVPDPYLLVHPSGLQLVFSHRPILPLEPGVLNLHGHIHNNPAPELGARHVNLCVEVRYYRPWRLSGIVAPYLPPHR